MNTADVPMIRRVSRIAKINVTLIQNVEDTHFVPSNLDVIFIQLRSAQAVA